MPGLEIEIPMSPREDADKKNEVQAESQNVKNEEVTGNLKQSIS